MHLEIRPAQRADLAAIRDIYNDYVARSTCTFQMAAETEAERREWFENRTSGHPVLVAEAEGDVVGWAALSPWKSRCAYAHTAEVSVYVRRDWHRRGVGRALVRRLLELAAAAGHHTILGGICTEQTASLALFETLGFERVACFREVGYKFGRWLDVAYMQYILPPGRGASAWASESASAAASPSGE